MRGSERKLSNCGSVFKKTSQLDGTNLITLAPVGTVSQGTVGFKVKGTTGIFQRIEVN